MNFVLYDDTIENKIRSLGLLEESYMHRLKFLKVSKELVNLFQVITCNKQVFIA